LKWRVTPTMKTKEIKDIVREYIVEHFVRKQGDLEFKDNDSLIEKGIIDSTGLLELVLFIEEMFSIKVEDEELIPDNFDSLDLLDSYIKHKTSSSFSG
jgi:acyl carrier protein